MTADPASQLRDLSKLSSVQKITGGEMSTYAFIASGLQGTVTVSGGKVRSLTATVDNPARDDAPAYHRKIIVTLSGYGDPVQVRSPW